MSRSRPASTIRESRFPDAPPHHGNARPGAGHACAGPAGRKARRYTGGSAAGLTLLEVMVAVTIAGLVSTGVVFSFRIGVRAWEKSQQATMQLRRTTSIEDGIHLQLSACVPVVVEAQAGNRTFTLPFFFGEKDRLVFVTAYSIQQRGRGGMVTADYFTERQNDGTWKLWLNERTYLEPSALVTWLAGVERRADNLDYPVLRPFDKQNATLLWEGLRGCTFRYRRQFVDPPDWVSTWSALAFFKLPEAVEVLPFVNRETWRGLPPAPIAALLPAQGVRQ